jgi:hypothetical protein
MKIDGLDAAIARANRKVARIPKTDQTAGDLAGSIVDLVYSYSGQLSVAAAVGALELAKHAIIHAQETDNGTSL